MGKMGFPVNKGKQFFERVDKLHDEKFGEGK